MDQIKVSVIVPVYNIESYLPTCVESLLAQTLQEIEIILVNDGSTDSSGSICESYAEKSSKIKVVHQKNQGLSAARNTGIRHAQGRYIGFVDGDDWVSSEMYERLYEELVKNKAQLAVCRYEEVYERPQQRDLDENITVMTAKEAQKAFFLRKISESVWDKLFASELWEDVNFPVGEINEDTVVVYNLIQKANKIIDIQKILYYYRKREGSITRSGYSEKFRVVEKHLQNIERQVKQKDPELISYMKYFTGVHYYCLVLAVIKERRNIYHEDYIRYRKGFCRCYREFMKWGTGKTKDRILASMILCRCTFLIALKGNGLWKR